MNLSHPVWVCGLKPSYIIEMLKATDVTPCMGVWIETLIGVNLFKIIKVTPCMGVWIETETRALKYEDINVTPCMGVWIETYIMRLTVMRLGLSHPVWVCGLKPA